MNSYELMFIVDPDVSDDALEKVITKFKDVITKNGGDVLKVDDHGIKSLAYKINKKPQGHYFLCLFNGPGGFIVELERNLRIDENIMRFVVTRIEEVVDKDDIKEEVEVEDVSQSSNEI
ncbi:MAG: 30S ribosomal protein S6 [Thermodesulfobacteriota bacterium]|nr:30S ribosomal protein S6 [Thermodesulfobacteriota bacterium]